MLFARNRAVLRLAVCLFVLVGSTSTSVSHEHTRGRVPHAHGFGLLPGATVAPAGLDDDDPHARHSHYVVLGFEFCGGEEPPSPDDSRTPAVCPADAVPLSADDQVTLDLWSPPVPAEGPRAAVVAAATASPPGARPPGRNSLCDRARRERSGVRLV